MTEALLQISNLSAAYGQVFALRDFSCAIEEGKITALVGSNGDPIELIADMAVCIDGPVPSQMPLADMDRVVTVGFQKLGNRHLAFAKVHVVNVVLDDRVDPRPQVMTPCEQRGSRGRADGGSRMEVSEADAFRGQLVQRRSLHRSAVATDVLRAQIIGQKDCERLVFADQVAGAPNRMAKAERFHLPCIGNLAWPWYPLTNGFQNRPLTPSFQHRVQFEGNIENFI